MAKPYFVKFEVPENLVSPIYESLRVAVQTGKVKRGTNEATKAIERGVSKLIIIAEDVEPPEVVASIAKIKSGKSEPAAKPEATEPEATEPAAKPEATEPAAKPEQ